MFCGRLDTLVENPFLFQKKKTRLCSECCAILYIHAKQEKERENLGHPSVLQLQPYQFCDPSCQIGAICSGFAVCRMNRVLCYGLYADRSPVEYGLYIQFEQWFV